MLKNLFSLKTSLSKICLLKGEVDLFNKIDPEIIGNFKKIIKKINSQKIDFEIIDQVEDKTNILSFVDNKQKNFYPLDYKNPWSNYNFFLNYFKNGDFKFDISVFQKLHFSLGKCEKFKRINKFLTFLPFYFITPKKNSRDFFNRIFPSIKPKDASVIGNNHFMGKYCFHYKKTSLIKKLSRIVIKNLDDNFSRKNYEIFFNKNTEANWKNYFKKSLNSYQYSDYIKLNEDSVIINCGVENGMDLKLFNGVSEIFNIDPSKDKFLDEIVKYILKKSKTKNHFIDYLLYTDRTVSEKQNYKIKTLKNLINDVGIKKISLIKSDIEGAERYMLKDLIEICEKFNCQLAISIYHTNHELMEDEKLNDLVNIPIRLIEKLRNNYKFYFNNYSYQRWEGILYCIPK